MVISDARNVIVINFCMGSRGHQIGRLVASSPSVKWFNYAREDKNEGNGWHPWLPAYGIDNADLSKFHFNRRYSGAKGWGVDDYTLPPVLDMARMNGAKNERPTEVFDIWLAKTFPQNIMYPTHGDLDESHDFFRGKHIVVLETDIDRYLATSSRFMVGNKLSGEKESMKEKWQREHYNDFTYGLKSYKTYVEELLAKKKENYLKHITPDDFVINSIDDLLDEDGFKFMCQQFDLEYDVNRFMKVHDFVKYDNYNPDNA